MLIIAEYTRLFYFQDTGRKPWDTGLRLKDGRPVSPFVDIHVPMSAAAEATLQAKDENGQVKVRRPSFQGAEYAVVQREYPSVKKPAKKWKPKPKEVCMNCNLMQSIRHTLLTVLTVQQRSRHVILLVLRTTGVGSNSTRVLMYSFSWYRLN